MQFPCALDRESVVSPTAGSAARPLGGLGTYLDWLATPVSFS